MTENLKSAVNTVSTISPTVKAPTSQEKELVKIQGILTSSIQLRGEETKEPYYYSFIRLKGQSIDLPVIFKIKGRPVDRMIMTNNDKYCLNCSAVANYPNRLSHSSYCQYNQEGKERPEEDNWIKPNLKKTDEVELNGNYSNSPQSIRKSFTAHSYQLLNEKKIRKKCFGCLDTFTCSQSKNYDYCKNCELNGSRYLQNKCSECGDGSGTIKFPNQPPRNCKTCYLAKKAILEQVNKAQLPKFEQELANIRQIRQQLEKYE